MKLSTQKWLWLLPVGAAGVTVAVLAILNQSIEAQTSPENSDARLETRRYQASIEDVRRSTLEIIPQLKKYGAHWRVIASEPENLIVAEVPVLVFTDDLTVTLRDSDGATMLDIHSKTRFPGKSDLGENRRHVLQLLAALDAKFKQAKS